MNKIENRKKVFIFFVVLLLALSTAEIFASGVEAMPWDNGLDKISKALTGRTVMLIGTLVFIGAGITAMFVGSGVLQTMLWIVAGLGIAINAPNLANMLAGNAAAAVGYLITVSD